MARHPALERRGTIAMAHRGGGAEAPENSRAAFRRAVDLGYRWIETDVRATSDGVLVICHDATLDRTTDLRGPVASMPWAQVSGARVGGVDPVMALADVVAEFPATCFNLDLKSDDAVEPFLALVAEVPEVLDRVCVGSFSDARLARLRDALGPRLATSAGPREVVRLVARRRGAPARFVPQAPVAAQVPERMGIARVVDAGFVRRCHAHGVQVHVWTVDDEPAMHRLLDLGVDGLITDRPSLLRDVLERRGSWEGPT